jgi:hypothetical protein
VQFGSLSARSSPKCAPLVVQLGQERTEHQTVTKEKTRAQTASMFDKLFKVIKLNRSLNIHLKLVSSRLADEELACETA